MRDDLPSSTVTFLFTDVEGSTRLLHSLGAEAYAAALAEHRRVIRDACAAEGGVEVDTQGDAFFFAFPTAPGAIAAASAFTEALASGPIQVRVGLHTGTPLLTEEGYVGDDVHFAARMAASGHGGQVVLSSATAVLIEPGGSEQQALSLLDLGEHRLKDIAEAVSIYQLGGGRFPPLKTISNTNLPHPASSFVGRERELEEVLSRIEAGARLVTLTGPGGTGKTRLALEAAASLVGEYKAGVFWVGLASLRDPNLVTETISQTLGAKNGLAEHIGARELLLLLDNLEQVIESAPELPGLLSVCPNLTLLVTSRELLRVQGEVEYPVPPLAAREALALFCARSRLDPDETIGELCRRLDNLPLAVELAAARTRALTPGQILERLSSRFDLLTGGRDADPRQVTLRATIDWSYELLFPAEQELFARLSVFSGGCTLEAAEEVCGASLDTLQSLVEKSLLRFSDERYWMLETIREYSLERLEESSEAEEMQRRHEEYFLKLAQEAEPHVEDEALRGGSGGEWLDRLERELDNLRTALDQLGASGETERALELTGALSYFWASRGHVVEGLSRLERALRSDERPTAARAKALIWAAELAGLSGDPVTMELLGEEALALCRKLGDPRGIALSLHRVGYAVGELGDWVRAQQLLAESLRIFGGLGEDHYALWLTRALAWTYAEWGDLDRARALYEDGLDRARALGSRSAEAALLGSLAWLAVTEGRLQHALPLLQQSLGIKREIGDRSEIAIGLCSAARAIAALGRVETAARLLSCFEALAEETGGGEGWVTRMKDETLATIRTRLDDPTFTEAWEQGRQLTVDEAVALAIGELE
jgi:predicted ATPase/class 3 adenylate cyclase